MLNDNLILIYLTGLDSVEKLVSNYDPIKSSTYIDAYLSSQRRCHAHGKDSFNESCTLKQGFIVPGIEESH